MSLTDVRHAGANPMAVQGKAVHQAAACDGCDMFPIRGPRFKSITIVNFDLCEACVLTSDAGGKEFLKFERPGDEGTAWLKPDLCGQLFTISEVLDAPSFLREYLS